MIYLDTCLYAIDCAYDEYFAYPVLNRTN